MMKTLILDIGNTFIKATVFQEDDILSTSHFRHEELEALKAFIGQSGAVQGAFSAVGEVSPEVKEILSTAAFPIREIKVSDIPETLVANRYSTPQTLGIDRIAAAIGAMTLSPDSDILVIDAGTCITYDILIRHEYLGGNISPGIEMRLKAMHAFTARLPLVSTEGDAPQIGYDTETAMRSGVLNGISYEIDGFIGYFKSKFPRLKVYLTGGSSKLLRISNKNHTFADDFLVERGIFAILKAETNK